MDLKSPVDMIYFSQPWMFITIFPISIFLEGKLVSIYYDSDYINFMQQFQRYNKIEQ